MYSTLRAHFQPAILVEWRATELEIEKHANRMRQHFATQSMLQMPEVAHSNAGPVEAFGQMRADRFDAVA